jgi:hypothetical protein
MTEKPETIKIKSEIQFKVCRLCFLDSEILISIEDQRKNVQIQSLLELLCGTQITDLEHTPRSICLNCLGRLDVVIEMMELCKKSEKVLKNLQEPDYDGFVASYLDKAGPLIETGDFDWSLKDEEPEPFDPSDDEKPLRKPKKSPAKKKKPDYSKLSAEKLVAKGIMKPQKKGRTRVPKPKLICISCGASFKYLSELTAHEYSHTTGGKPFTCDLCGTGFINKMNVINHMKIVHMGQQRFHCPVCGKFVKKSFNFKMHLNSHSKEQKFVCEFPIGEGVCGKVFWRKGLRDIHQRTHTGNFSIYLFIFRMKRKTK